MSATTIQYHTLFGDLPFPHQPQYLRKERTLMVPEDDLQIQHQHLNLKDIQYVKVGCTFVQLWYFIVYICTLPVKYLFSNVLLYIVTTAMTILIHSKRCRCRLDLKSPLHFYSAISIVSAIQIELSPKRVSLWLLWPNLND